MAQNIDHWMCILSVVCLCTWPVVCAGLLRHLWPASRRLVPFSVDCTFLPAPAYAANTAPLHWPFQPPALPSASEPKKQFYISLLHQACFTHMQHIHVTADLYCV